MQCGVMEETGKIRPPRNALIYILTDWLMCDRRAAGKRVGGARRADERAGGGSGSERVEGQRSFSENVATSGDSQEWGKSHVD
jgi:hypothetical protein